MDDASLHIERYEMKYRIPRQMVRSIRDAVLRYCVPDQANQGGRYLITSLYLDSPDRRLYQDTAHRSPRRFKLRVRRYASGKYFLEVKRKVKDVIAKTRCAIDPASWPNAYLDPTTVDASLFDGIGARAYQEFVNKSLLTMAEPAALVRYDREAYVATTDDYARVTFDHNLQAAAPNGWRIDIDDSVRWQPADTPGNFGLPFSGVVLELKCTATVPFWMADLVNQFNLKRSGFSKYQCCLDRVEPRRFAASSHLSNLYPSYV